MSGWETFFAGELGASAALSGLVFVGVSVNLAKIIDSSILPNRALEALMSLVAILFVSSLLLIPGETLFTGGIEVLAVGLIEGVTVLVLQIAMLRKIEAQYRRKLLRVVCLYQLALVLFIIAGILLLFQQEGGLYWLVAAFIASFCATFVDVWVLLIEINR